SASRWYGAANTHAAPAVRRKLRRCMSTSPRSGAGNAGSRLSTGRTRSKRPAARIGRPTNPVPADSIRLPSLLGPQQVGELAICSRNTAGNSESGVLCEYVDALPISGPQFAGERLLARIGRRDHGPIFGIPLGGEVQSVLLHPAFEIFHPSRERSCWLGH